MSHCCLACCVWMLCDRPLHRIGQFTLEQQVRLNHDSSKAATGNFGQHFVQPRLRHGQEADEDVMCHRGIVTASGRIHASLRWQNHRGYRGRRGSGPFRLLEPAQHFSRASKYRWRDSSTIAGWQPRCSA